jgi:K+-transporting ATPase KdpF subunit
MTFELWAGALVSVVLFVYLAIALIKPEKF